MEGFAGERQVRLAESFVLGGVGVHEGRDVVGVPLPVVDQLGLADQLADPVADQVDADAPARPGGATSLTKPCGLEDLALAVAGQVVGDGLDGLGAVPLTRLRLGRARPRRPRGGSRSPAGCRPRRSASARGRRSPRRRRCPAGTRGAPAADPGRCRRRRRRPARLVRSRSSVSTKPRSMVDALLGVAEAVGDGSATDRDQQQLGLEHVAALDASRRRRSRCGSTLWNGVPVRMAIPRLRKARSSDLRGRLVLGGARSRGSASTIVTVGAEGAPTRWRTRSRSRRRRARPPSAGTRSSRERVLGGDHPVAVDVEARAASAA